MDSLNFPIRYSFIDGTPSYYAEYFTIDSQFGTVKQIKAVDTSMTKRFSITVKVSVKQYCVYTLPNSTIIPWEIPIWSPYKKIKMKNKLVVEKVPTSAMLAVNESQKNVPRFYQTLDILYQHDYTPSRFSHLCMLTLKN